MKKIFYVAFVLFSPVLIFTSCSEKKSDQRVQEHQNLYYTKTQPASIPMEVMIQIYNEAHTYTVIESITGEVKFHGPSLGYGLPADMSLTNPLQTAYSRHYSSGEVIEQAEPNGLFSSKNTNGTWVLFVDINGDITPIYTEHKVTTYPFVVKMAFDGSWERAVRKNNP